MDAVEVMMDGGWLGGYDFMRRIAFPKSGSWSKNVRLVDLRWIV